MASIEQSECCQSCVKSEHLQRWDWQSQSSLVVGRDPPSSAIMKRKAFIGSLRSQESLECISFVVFSLHYGMTDVAWGGSKVNILQLHLSPRPNGFSSAGAGAGGGYHQLSSLRLTSNIEWFNDSIMSHLPSMLNNIFYVSKDEFQFTLLYI